MKRSKNDAGRRKLELRKERLRQLDHADLDKVGGGWDWWRTCMGTWANYTGNCN